MCISMGSATSRPFLFFSGRRPLRIAIVSLKAIMDFTSKRLSAGLLAGFFAVASVVFPVSAHAVTINMASNLTGSQWYVPMQGTGLAGTRIAATAATMLGRANPWIAAITLGTPVMQYLLEKNGGGEIAIRAKDGPMATPPGWTNGPNGVPVPPSQVASAGGSSYAATPQTTSKVSVYYADFQGTQTGGNYPSTAAAAAYALSINAYRPDDVTRQGGAVLCANGSSTISTGNSLCTAAKRTSDNATLPPTSISLNTVTGSPSFSIFSKVGCPLPSVEVAGQCQTQTCPNGGTLSGTTCTVAATCPTGYAPSQGYCTIIDPWAVKFPADGIPTLVPTLDGAGLQTDPRDPDPMPQTPNATEIMNPSASYQRDPFGNPTSTQILPQSGGGFKVDQRVQTTNNNQTTTTINNLTINNLGNVTNISTTTVPGTIETAAPGQTPTTQFPTDYNRETTQQAVKSKLDEIQAGTGAAEAPDYAVDQKKTDMNQAITDKLEALPGQYPGDKGNWFSWVWTPPVGSCSPWVSSIHGQSVTWDICPYIAKVRDVIGYLLAVLSAAAVYSQLFRKED